MNENATGSGRRESAGDASWRPDRRRFVQTVMAGGLAWTAGGLITFGAAAPDRPRVRRIVVDYGKCTGCRTCETVCAQNAAKVEIDGAALWGLGNPASARIRVYHFNPDVDVPVACVLCDDAPCIEACPVKPDQQGRRALYKDPATGVVRNDIERCIGCRSCETACREKRVGAIVADAESGKPEGLCTLCEGEPLCVKYCPFEALAYRTVLPEEKAPAAASPKAVAGSLAAKWYDVAGVKGGGQHE